VPATAAISTPKPRGHFTILNAYEIAIEGKQVLEFGCNVGGSAVVLAQLGGQIAALDMDANVVEVARRNARRFGVDPNGFGSHYHNVDATDGGKAFLAARAQNGASQEWSFAPCGSLGRAIRRLPPGIIDEQPIVPAA
jgi:SAM-dependent methyltransferase